MPQAEVAVDYGARLRDLRSALGIAQGALAARMSMTQPNLCESELGRRAMSEAEFLRGQAALIELRDERNAAFAEARKAVTA